MLSLVKVSLFFMCNAQVSEEIKLNRNMLQHLKDSSQDLKNRKEIYNQLVSKVNKKKRFGLLAQDTAKVNKFLLVFISYILVMTWTLNLSCFDYEY